MDKPNGALKRTAVIITLLAMAALGLWAAGLFKREGWAGIEDENPSSFGLMGYAKGMVTEEIADSSQAGSGAVEISGGEWINLPSGRMIRGAHYYIPAGGDEMDMVYFGNWEAGSLKCVGEGIIRATFEAETGGFAEFANITVARDADYGYIYTRKSELPRAVCDKFSAMDYTEQIEYINSGGLDAYLGEDFREDFPSVHSAIKSGELSLWCGEVDSEGRPWFSEYFDAGGGTRCEVQATYWRSGNSDRGAWELGASVTISPEDTVSYCPPFSVFQAVTSDGPLNYSAFEEDTITVSVEFENGETAVKRIIVSFDGEGNLCARLDT